MKLLSRDCINSAGSEAISVPPMGKTPYGIQRTGGVDLTDGQGEAQEFGTDSEPRFFGRFVTDLKSYFAVLNREINHPARLDEPLGFAHRQHARTVQSVQDFLKIIFF
jgi:hypothetical protein